MKLTVSCGLCDVVLAVVEKTQITDADISLYQRDCSCAEDSQQDIITIVE